jgi:RimJ/RimL family protein N-acetyltransferase
VTILPLETDRLLLRFFTPGDEAIHQLVFADPEVAVPFCGTTRTLEQVRDWLVCRAVQATTDEFGFWAVERRADGALLGLVGLQPYVPDWIVWPDDPHPTYRRIGVETSYAFGRQHWNHGYATEATRAVLDYAFGVLRLARVAYAVDAANERSVRLMRRLGFGEIRNLHPAAVGSFLGALDNDRIRSPRVRR